MSLQLQSSPLRVPGNMVSTMKCDGDGTLGRMPIVQSFVIWQPQTKLLHFISLHIPWMNTSHDQIPKKKWTACDHLNRVLHVTPGGLTPMGGLHFTEPSDDLSHSAARFSKALPRHHRRHRLAASPGSSLGCFWVLISPGCLLGRWWLVSRKQLAAGSVLSLPRQQPCPAGPGATARSREKEGDTGNDRL